jgi:hypothetical protein
VTCLIFKKVQGVQHEKALSIVASAALAFIFAFVTLSSTATAQVKRASCGFRAANTQQQRAKQRKKGGS